MKFHFSCKAYILQGILYDHDKTSLFVSLSTHRPCVFNFLFRIWFYEFLYLSVAPIDIIPFYVCVIMVLIGGGENSSKYVRNVKKLNYAVFWINDEFELAIKRVVEAALKFYNVRYILMEEF